MKRNNDSSVIDSREAIGKLDKANVLGSIEALADQVKHAWQSTQALNFSVDTARVQNVVVTGMGGSGLGPDIFKHLFADTLSVPFEIYNGYQLPAYVSEHSLVVLSSYSGGTEETVSCAKAVKATGAQVLVITSGGELGKIAAAENYPAYIIDPVHNPSGQPRMAIGYAVFGLIGLLGKAGLVKITDEQVAEIITTIISTSEKLGPETLAQENQAKLLAFNCVERRPILVGSEFLVGAVHTATNQFNENAKIYADFKVLPEINHHLLEGLRFPKSNAGSHYFIFFNSKLLQARNQKRLQLSQQVMEKNGMDAITVDLTADTKFAQVFELLTLMSYTNFYVSMLEGIDPGPIPTVDWFKEQLGK
jgi:glucose/mannose-6-phosphate isomerase